MVSGRVINRSVYVGCRGRSGLQKGRSWSAVYHTAGGTEGGRAARTDGGKGEERRGEEDGGREERVGGRRGKRRGEEMRV